MTDLGDPAFDAGRRCAEIAYARRTQAIGEIRTIVINDVQESLGQGAAFRLVLECRMGRAANDAEVRDSAFVVACVIRWNELVRGESRLLADVAARPACACRPGSSVEGHPISLRAGCPLHAARAPW